MTGVSMSVRGPDGEWTPLAGVSDFEPTMTTEVLADALYQAREVEPTTWTMPIRAMNPDEWRQYLAVQRVRAGAIAWWNEAQR